MVLDVRRERGVYRGGRRCAACSRSARANRLPRRARPCAPLSAGRGTPLQLGEEGQRSVGGGVKVGETGVGQLGGTPRDRHVHQAHRACVVPLLRSRRDWNTGQDEHTDHRNAAGRRREQRTHERKIIARSGRGNGHARSGLEGDPARYRHAGVRVCAAPRRAISASDCRTLRFCSSQRPGRRRHVGALHLSRRRAARSVETLRWNRAGLDRRDADGTATGAPQDPFADLRAIVTAFEPVAAPNSARSGAAPSAISRTTPYATSRNCRTRRRRA